MVIPVSQGSVVSAIGGGITSIIRAIAFVLESVIGAIVGVRTIVDEYSASHLNLLSQIIVAIFNVFTDILCCRCGKRRSTRHTTHATHSHATHTTRARGRKGRRHAH
jgi:hypothetical protein